MSKHFAHKKTVSAAIMLILIVIMQLSAYASTPINIEQTNKDGTEYIIKTFELPPDGDAGALIETDFESNRYLFSYQAADTQEIISEQEKEIKITKEVSTKTNSTSAILKLFEPNFDYEEDGMTGKLYIDPSSLTTEVAGYTNQSYTISDTRDRKSTRLNSSH